MGKSTIPAYAIDYILFDLTTNARSVCWGIWNCKNSGRPTQENLRKFVAHFENFQRKSGNLVKVVNAEVSRNDGFPEVVATYVA